MAMYQGGIGDDGFTDGTGDDIFLYGDVTYDGTTIVSANGFDTISGAGGGIDVLNFGSVTSLDYLYGVREGDDFVIYLQPTTGWTDATALTTLGGVRIANFFAADGSGVVERVEVQNGYAELSYVNGVFRTTIHDAGGTLLGSNVEGSSAGETLVGTAVPDTINGAGGNDTIIGNGGADELSGGEGNDTLRGGAGADTLIGGNGIDTADYSDFTTGVTVNLSLGTGGDGDSLSGIENVIGGLSADTLQGNSQDNVLDGGSGTDVFVGSGGSDTYFGGSNAGGVDIINYNGSFGGQITADLAAGTVIKASGGTDNLFGIEAIGGSLGNDFIYGDDNGNFLRGRAGNDTLDGRGGVDTLAFDMDTATTGVVASLESGSSTSATDSLNNGNDTFSNFENLRGTRWDDTLTGDAGNNRIEGGRLTGTSPLDSGNDTLYGRGGSDTLLGGAGNDSLYGEEGSDVLVGGAGNDLLDGGMITDPVNSNDGNIVDYTGVAGSVVLSLQNNFASSDGEGGQDTLANINQVIGGNANDMITGSNRLVFEVLEGGAGDDVLDGGALAADDFYQVSGNRVTYQRAGGSVTVDLDTDDSVGLAPSGLTSSRATGAQGNDTLANFNQVRGSNFDDFLYGSSRTDVVEVFEGGGGNDYIDGRGGLDVARYDAAGGSVTVDLRIVGVAQQTGAAGADTLLNIEGVRGSAFADVLIGGNTANDALEVFRGQGGNDFIDGGSGFDRVEYTNATAGVSVTLGGGLAGSANDGQGGTDTLWNIEAVRGSLFGDSLTGSNANNEEFDGRQGDDLIDGGGGTGDVAVYSGNRSDFVFSRTSDGALVVSDTRAPRDGVAFEGTDTVRNVEQFRFFDGVFTQAELEPPNQPPVISGPLAVLAAGTEDTPYVIAAADLLQGFSDAEGDPLSVANVQASDGSLVDNADGTWTFTPIADFNGTVSVTYDVVDGRGGAAAGNQSFTIAAVNDAPTGAPTAALAAAVEDTAYTLSATDLLAGFGDVDGDVPSVANLLVSHGMLSDNQDGTWTFTPDADSNGNVTLSYDVIDGHGGVLPVSRSLLVAAVNDAPSGVPTGTLPAATEDTAYFIATADLLAGVSDVDGDPLSVSGITASSGVLTAATGGWTFSPSANFNGTVTLTYAVTDGQGGSLSASRAFSVAPVNDAPTASVVSASGLSISFTATDVDGGALGLAAPLAAAFGNPAVNNGSLTSLNVVQQATAVSGVLRLTDGIASSPDLVGVALGSGGNDNLSAPLASRSLLYGFEGNDTLAGGNGNDLLTGGIGRDTQTGGAGDDTFQLSNGDFAANESIDGGAGSADRLQLLNSTTVNLAAGTVLNVEQLAGSNGADAVTLSAAQFAVLSQMDLGGGNDSLTVLLGGSVTGLGNGTLAGIESVQLAGGNGNETLSISGLALDTFLSAGSATINFGGGSSDTLAVTGTSTVLNGLSDAALSGLESISAAAATSGVTIRMASQTEALSVAGSAQADVLVGGTGGDTLRGAAGDDVLSGGSGADVLYGGTGSDTIYGGAGNDQLYGGDSKTVGDGVGDTFVFDTTPNAASNLDTIFRFEAGGTTLATGVDKIWLDASLFAQVLGGVGPANFRSNVGGIALDSNDFILYDSKTGTLYYDADGNGAGAKVAFAAIDTKSLLGTLDASDFLVGTLPGP